MNRASKPKILFIDDDPIYLHRLKEFFEKDYEIIQAGENLDSLEKLKMNMDISVIVSDIERYFGCNGITNWRNICCIKPDIPYIFYTLYTTEQCWEMFSDNEKPYAVIFKYDGSEELAKVIKRALS